MEEELSMLTNEEIKNLIYTIRGKQVMLDSDVAMLYQCETKYVNRVVKRNVERFPEEFCFQLKENELEFLRCQFVTSKNNGIINNNNRGGRRYLPYVFAKRDGEIWQAKKKEMLLHSLLAYFKSFSIFANCKIISNFSKDNPARASETSISFLTCGLVTNSL